MNNFENRLKKIEKILTPKIGIVIILDEMTDKSESYLEMNGNKYSIPPGDSIEGFINEKIKNTKGVLICGLYLSANKKYLQGETGL